MSTTHTCARTDFILTYKGSVSIVVHSTSSCRKKAFQYCSAGWSLAWGLLVPPRSCYVQTFSHAGVDHEEQHFSPRTHRSPPRQAQFRSMWSDSPILTAMFYYLHSDDLIILFKRLFFFREAKHFSFCAETSQSAVDWLTFSGFPHKPWTK